MEKLKITSRSAYMRTALHEDQTNLYKRVVRNCLRGFPMIDGQQFSTQNVGRTVIIQRMKDFLSIVQILFPNVYLLEELRCGVPRFGSGGGGIKTMIGVSAGLWLIH